ncbi:MAG: hypothetical protein NUW07_10775 [Candidatus Saccharicenans sp.]|nr:hypothetical protein [Candidatus Saccharicenans sp.]MDH7492508.1 hypothetical protein [Candidatus Saccharicenans sp.]
MAKIIMIIYYLLSAFFVFITAKNLIQEKNSRDRVILYLVTLIPFILRLLRIK